MNNFLTYKLYSYCKQGNKVCNNWLYKKACPSFDSDFLYEMDKISRTYSAFDLSNCQNYHFIIDNILFNSISLIIILDGNSDIVANVRSNLCFFFIWLRHSIRYRAVANPICFSHKNFFSFMPSQHVLSHHLIKVPWLWSW